MPDPTSSARAALPNRAAPAQTVGAQVPRTQAQAPRAQAPRAVPLPRTWSVTAVEIILVLVANGVLIVAMWVRHGGLDQASTFGGILTGTGQLTALFGTYLALIQLVLMSRSPWLDQVFGMDRLTAAHRWIGFATVWLLLGHGIFITIGYGIGDRKNPVAEFLTLVTTYPYVLMATVSGGLFATVAISSIKAARRRLSYETWYGIHLYAYLAIALGFLHQLFVGTDFAHDPVAVGYWVSLYLVAVALVLAFRVLQPIGLNLRHRLRVARVVSEAPGVFSIYVTGRGLDQLAVRSGQYFVWRFLTRDGWWRGHPFSISSAPNGSWLRITIKELGDWSAALKRMTVGTRVFVEGPYGILTGAKRTRQRVLLIAGGIGITPLRSLLEALPARPGDLTLLYRVRDERDILFRDELETLARIRGAEVQYLPSRRPQGSRSIDPLGPAGLQALVPDVRHRDVYVCGPVPMMQHVESSLRRLGLPSRQIHVERFAY
jgi:predicted ferric reductase